MARAIRLSCLMLVGLASACHEPATAPSEVRTASIETFTGDVSTLTSQTYPMPHQHVTLRAFTRLPLEPRPLQYQSVITVTDTEGTIITRAQVTRPIRNIADGPGSMGFPTSAKPPFVATLLLRVSSCGSEGCTSSQGYCIPIGVTPNPPCGPLVDLPGPYISEVNASTMICPNGAGCLKWPYSLLR
jgi:hypothetical protein